MFKKSIENSTKQKEVIGEKFIEAKVTIEQILDTIVEIKAQSDEFKTNNISFQFF